MTTRKHTSWCEDIKAYSPWEDYGEETVGRGSLLRQRMRRRVRAREVNDSGSSQHIRGWEYSACDIVTLNTSQAEANEATGPYPHDPVMESAVTWDEDA